MVLEASEGVCPAESGMSIQVRPPWAEDASHGVTLSAAKGACTGACPLRCAQGDSGGAPASAPVWPLLSHREGLGLGRVAVEVEHHHVGTRLPALGLGQVELLVAGIARGNRLDGRIEHLPPWASQRADSLPSTGLPWMPIETNTVS